MNKAKIGQKVSDVRGGESSFKPDLGYILINVDGSTNKILVDAFEGDGDDDIRRDVALITITNGVEMWEGTFDELIEKLTQIDDSIQ